MCREFRSSCCSGGVGLTPTAANYVIHFARCGTQRWRISARTRKPKWPNSRCSRVPASGKYPTFAEQSFYLLLDALIARKRAQSEDALTPADASGEEMTALLSGTLGA